MLKTFNAKVKEKITSGLMSPMASRAVHFAVNNAAYFLKTPVLIFPVSIQSYILEKTLNTIFSEAITDGDFLFLENKWLELEVSDLSLKFWLSFKANKVIVTKDRQEHELRFSGKLNDYILLIGRKEDPDSLFFKRRLIIEGDTEMGLELKNLIDSVDFEQWPTVLQQSIDKFSNLVNIHWNNGQNQHV